MSHSKLINQSELCQKDDGFVSYFIYYQKSDLLKKVGKRVFSTAIGPVICSGFKKVRVVGCTSRQKAFNRVKAFLAQGWFDDLSHTYSGAKMLFNVLKKVGEVKETIKDKGSVLLVSVIKLIMEVKNLLDGSFDFNGFMQVLLSIYNLHAQCFSSQSFDVFMIAGIAAMLPKKLVELLRTAQLLTHMKFGDDLGILNKLIASVFGICDVILNYIPESFPFRESVVNFLSFIKSRTAHVWIADMEKFLRDVEKDPSKLLNVSYRLQLKQFDCTIQKAPELLDWTRRSAALVMLMTRWKDLMRVVVSYDQPDRVEPNCFVFEGPPGVMKSVVMNAVIECSDMSCYSHLVKSTSDSHDWYDAYNNEEIFFMDDVGQQGISQWRTIINMVSSTKMPLECAQAHLKDMKFFNSKHIFVTTNLFSGITNTVRQDCISDLHALWRRGYIFDFSGTYRSGDFLEGIMTFRHWDLATSKFVDTFPQEFARKYPSIKPYFQLDKQDSKRKWKLVAWILSIVKGFGVLKKDFNSSNAAGEDDIELVQSIVKNNLENQFHDAREDLVLEAQVLSWRPSVDFDGLLQFFESGIHRLKWFGEVVHSFLEDLMETLSSCIDMKYLYSGVGLICMFVMVKSFLSMKRLNYSNKDYDAQTWREDFKYDDGKSNTLVAKVQSQCYDIDLYYNGVKMQGYGLASGRHVLVPKHFIGEGQGYIVIYKSRRDNHIIVDHEVVVEKWSSVTDDVAVLALPSSFPTPFSNLCNFFLEKENSGLCAVVNACGLHYINGSVESLKTQHSYAYGVRFVNQIGPKDFVYGVQGMGLCGSVVVNPTGGVLGMHVAGNVADNIGVALKWSSFTRSTIAKIFQGDKGLPWNMSDKVIENSSVVKLERKMSTTVPSSTKYGPSPLYGIYPVTRVPAELQRFGRFTVKDVAKKSFAPVKGVPNAEIEFGKKVLRSFLTKFSSLSEREVVLGNDLLARMNKDSSNGFACEKDKSVYIDFENGCLTQKCRSEIEEIESSIVRGEPKWDAFVWVESLKDELRNDEKDGVPRSFRIGTIHQQVLMKKYFGNMVAHLIKTRKFHGIMVGMNPYTEWPDLYNKLVKCKGIWAGDVKEWDGRMMSQAQRAATEVILEFYDGDKAIPQFLLETLVHSLVAVMDDFYLTTHSMPSGSFLTAIFNSIINKFYTAMWYYRECTKNGVEPSVKNFWNTVVDFVYGDDKLNGVMAHAEFLNALTMRDFFVSIGMDFTTASKQKISEPFEDISQVTFLKRSFVYHNILGRVVCPLELRTLYSGLSFCEADKDVEIVLEGKIGCFQREIYLHPDREYLLKDFIERMKQFKWNYEVLSPQYLLSVYSDENYQLDNFQKFYI